MYLDNLRDGMIDWCLTPTLAIFQLFRGVLREDLEYICIYTNT